MNRLYHCFSQNIIISIFFSFISSVAILPIIMLGEDETKNSLIRYLSPVIFWLGVIFEQVFIITASSVRKKLEKQPKNKKFKRNIGLFSVFSNKYASVFDLIFLATLVVFLVMCIFGLGVNVVQYVVLFILIFAFRMHCTLNGKNFRYKIYLQKKEG